MNCDFGMGTFWFGILTGIVMVVVGFLVYAKTEDALTDYQRLKEDAEELRRRRGY